MSGDKAHKCMINTLYLPLSSMKIMYKKQRLKLKYPLEDARQACEQRSVCLMIKVGISVKLPHLQKAKQTFSKFIEQIKSEVSF